MDSDKKTSDICVNLQARAAVRSEGKVGIQL